MKKYIVGISLLSIMACNDSEAPAAVESSTQHPNGVTGGAVISTDTGAILADSPRVKQDSVPDRK